MFFNMKILMSKQAVSQKLLATYWNSKWIVPKYKFTSDDCVYQ